MDLLQGYSCLLCYFLLLHLSTGAEGNADLNETTAEKETFYLLTLLPYRSPFASTNPSWTDGDNVRPAIDLAVDQINKREDILVNYNLEIVHLKDGCDEHLTSVTFADFVQGWYYTKRKKNLMALLGPGCSSSTIALARLVQHPAVDVVTVHDAGSPSLSNRSRYGNLLGALGSSRSFVESFLYLISRANWTKIAVLFDDSRKFFIDSMRLMLEQLNQHYKGVSVNYISPVSDTHIPLHDIQNLRLRVVFIFAPISLAEKILCLARSRGMFFKSYQYIFMSARLDDFVNSISFTYKGKSYSCSRDNLRDTLNKSFLVHYSLVPTSGLKLLANVTYDEYLSAYADYRENYTNLTGRSSVESYWANNLYDAVWAWSVVLDCLTKENKELNFESGSISDLILEKFYEVDFGGMSGRVVFDNSTGFIKREVIVSQAQGNSSCFVLFVNAEGERRCSETETCGSEVVIIEDTFQSKEVRESQGLAVFFLLLTSGQFIVTVVFHITTLYNKKTPSVKASSLKLLNISHLGIYIIIIGTFLWTLYSAASINIHLKRYFCQVLWTWTIPVGFSLAFIPILMITWRIYRIFIHYLDPGPFISTRHLLFGTFIATALYLTMSIIWSVWDPFTLDYEEHYEDYEEHYEDKEMAKTVIHVVYWYCTCNYHRYWLLVIGFLSLSLLFVGTIMALFTRNIRNSSFTTNSLRIFVYLMSIVTILGFGLYGISEVVERNPGNSVIYFSFTVLCTILNAVIFLFVACVFSPPLVPLASKPKVRIPKKISTTSRPPPSP